MANDDEPNDLPEPARDRGMIPQEQLGFRPKVNWKFWIPILVFVFGMIGVYFVTEAKRARKLRAQLLVEHAVLTESLAPPYRAVRARIEQLAYSAIGPWEGSYKAPDFSMPSLTAAPVLYARIRIPEIKKQDDLAPSLLHRYADQITSCLGVEINLARELYTKGEFLMPGYVESVRHIDSGNRLAALRQDLQFRLRRDTQDIVEWTRRRYLLLAVDEAALSIDGPTRLYVWDLTNGEIKFRSRGSGGESVLIPVRIAGMPGGGRPVPRPNNELTLTQHDCSVANVARAELGAPVETMRNAPAVPPRSTAADASPAASPDAAAAPTP